MARRSFAAQLQKEIEEKLPRDQTVDQQARRYAEGVAEDIREIARREAFDTGDYAASIKVRKRTGKRANGLPAYRVSSSDYKAAWIEYGTGDPGPTEEVAPFARVAFKHRGTPG